jgi:hypothetical protein
MMNELNISRSISISGDGVAAASCFRLLRDSGLAIHHHPAGRPHLAAVLLGSQTQGLLDDVFGDSNLFAGRHRINCHRVDCHRIDRRIVLWGENTQPVTLPHQGFVASEAQLLQRLWQLAHRSKSTPEASVALDRLDPSHAPSQIGFSILTIPSRLPSPSNTPATSSEDNLFGKRTATVMRVRLTTKTDPHACIIESTGHGWLFLLPLDQQSASLMSVSISTGLDAQLEHSRLVVHSIDTTSLDASTAIFPCAPRLHNPLCGDTHLLCGSAAMTFDPVCGEGVGHAVREAFLASAVVHALHRGEPSAGLFTHYAARLRFGFLRHLELCRGFYSSGGTTDFWRSELELLEQGITEMRSQLQSAGEHRYRLSGTRLIRI